jgi:hypothetical protein
MVCSLFGHLTVHTLKRLLAGVKPHLQFHAQPGKLREKLETIRVEVRAPAPVEISVASNQESKATTPPEYVYPSFVANRMAQEFETSQTPSFAAQPLKWPPSRSDIHKLLFRADINIPTT